MYIKKPVSHECKCDRSNDENRLTFEPFNISLMKAAATVFGRSVFEISEFYFYFRKFFDRFISRGKSILFRIDIDRLGGNIKNKVSEAWAFMRLIRDRFSVIKAARSRAFEKLTRQ